MALNTETLKRLGILVVVLHVIVTIPHAISHSLMHIDMNTWQTIYILVVISVAPVAAAVLLWKRVGLGFHLLALSMTGSFLFGVYYHFVAAGADNVRSVHAHSWSLAFQTTAVLLALVESIGALVGVYGITNESRHAFRNSR